MRRWWMTLWMLPALALGVPASHAGLFDAPEIQVVASPSEVRSLSLSAAEKPLDFDVSPDGAEAAMIVKDPKGGFLVRFWRLDGSQASPTWSVPRELTPRSIAWHPAGGRFFLTAGQGMQHLILRVNSVAGGWQSAEIHRSNGEIRRLTVGPRPFVVAYRQVLAGADQEQQAVESFRLFFGVKNLDGSYAVHSITEDGSREYQVVGPKTGFTHFEHAEVQPSEITARWALPLGFHPAGHLLLWEDSQHGFHVARYDRDHWADSRRLLDGTVSGGTVTATPNGLGLLHWRPDTDGITVIYDHGRTTSVQARGYRFLFTPSSVADGRGIVGLIRKDGGYALVYVPIEMPLADVANAWMFVESPADRALFGRNGGLLRDLKLEQLYALYDTEAYYCGGYDTATPTRPYLVTTDIFWELLAAAYEGWFIVTERQQTIPAFWDLVRGLEQHFRSTQPESPWASVCGVLKELQTPEAGQRNEELQLILRAQGRARSPLLGVELDYGELLPRGHYAADAGLRRYFKAFKYLTQLAPEAAPVEALQNLPAELSRKALAWIGPYQRFIAPPRTPLVWGDSDAGPFSHARHPLKERRLFPLSWGFDNEVLLSSVFHPDWPEAEQITGPAGPRLTPSALDLAAALGSDFALSLLQDALNRHPPLRPVLEELRGRYRNLSREEREQSLYSRWLDALAIQWAEEVTVPKGFQPKPFWQAKRLQTGLASWATLRHATVLVNERTAAECGEAGFEPIVLKPPRGYVEPDPRTFDAIASWFDALLAQVSATGSLQGEMRATDEGDLEPLRQGISRRLAATAEKARVFMTMAEKEVRGEPLSGPEYEEILYVGRVAEHHFLVFRSLANQELALSNPDPMAKIVDVAGGGPLNLPFLMAAVGNPMEWDQVVPFFGRRELVKGSVYSYYELVSEQLLDDPAWRRMLPTEAHPAWIAPFISREAASCPAQSPY